MTRISRMLGPRRKQSGISTILLILLVGLALVVTVHGVFSSVRGAQEQAISVHAKTPAQATAWYAGKAIERYLDGVDNRTLRKWIEAAPTADDPVNLQLSGTGAVDADEVTNVFARVIDIAKVDPDPADTHYRVTALVESRAGTAKVATSAALELVYQVDLVEEPAPGTEPDLPLKFYKDLRISGQVSLPQDTDIAVQGDVTIDAVSVEGIDDISATNNVSINSAVSVDRVHANGDVEITQGASADEVLSRGKILISGDGHQGLVRAHDDVTFRWAQADQVETGGDLIVGDAAQSCRGNGSYDNTYIASAKVEGDVLWHSCGAGLERLWGNGDLLYRGAGRRYDGTTSMAATQHLEIGGAATIYSAEATGRYTARGSVSHDTGAHPLVVRYCSQTSLALPQYNGGLFAAGDVVGYAPVISVDPRNEINVLRGAPSSSVCDFSLPEQVVEDVPEFVIEPPRVDANMLRTQANFEFERLSNGEFQVTVRNMNGVEDGVYVLGYEAAHAGNGYRDLPDFLCDAEDLTGSPNGTNRQRRCTEPRRRMCDTSFNLRCFDYIENTDPALSAWVVGNDNGAFTAPRGIYFFPGNVRVGQKAYVATWIATGNIDLGQNHRTYAPNLAGFDRLCRNASLESAEATPQTVTSPGLDGFYPTNLCGESDIVRNRLANVVAVAGGFDENGVFSGGTIRTVANGVARLDGMVIAGDQFISRGHTTVNGAVVGAGQGEGAADSGDLGNTFNLTDPDDPTFSTGMPCMSEACMKDPASTLWARYR